MRSFRTGTLTKKKIEEEKYILGDRWGISVRIEGKENDDRKIHYFKWEKEDLRKIFMNKKFGR